MPAEPAGREERARRAGKVAAVAAAVLLSLSAGLTLLVHPAAQGGAEGAAFAPAMPAVLSAAVLSAAMAQTPAFMQRHAPSGVGCPACHGADFAAAVPDAACLGCHGSHEELAALTRHVTPNPHAAHHVGAVRCSQCHNEHRPSVLFCNQCHVFEMDVP